MNNLASCQFIDIHYHSAPDLYTRRYNALEAGLRYQALNGAVILTSHLGATAVQATLSQAQGLPVFPSLVLNAIAGGIDYRVIMRALAEYQSCAKVKMLVHFPTITGRQYQSKLVRQLVYANLGKQTLKPETLFNSRNQLKKKAIDVVKMARDYSVILTTGHASKAEIYQLIDVCIQQNSPVLLLNQPANPLTDLKAAELKELAKHDFIWIEQTALTLFIGHQTKADFADVLSNIPRVIYSSDLGQNNQMDIKDWYHYSKALFAELSLSVTRQEDLWLNNALKLLTN